MVKIKDKADTMGWQEYGGFQPLPPLELPRHTTPN